MANQPTGIDVTAWHFPTKPELDQLWDMGVRVVASYISYDASKDLTAAMIRELHSYRRNSKASYGFGVLLNFESTASRALSGPTGGVTDGTYVRNRYHLLYQQTGYVPKNKQTPPFSVDFDTNPGQYATIDSYLAGAQRGLTTEFAAGVYGEYDLIVHTAHAGTSHFEWQTYAWSQGRFASGIADYYQWRNGVTLKQGRGIVDLDQMIADGHSPFGAWWPPTHPLNHPASSPAPPPHPAPANPSAAFDYPPGDHAAWFAAQLLRGALVGGDYPPATNDMFPNLVQPEGKGLVARLEAAEKRLAAVEKKASKP